MAIITEMPNGIKHLIDQSRQSEQSDPRRNQPPPWPEGKVLKARCILEGVDYYVPNGEAGFGDPPFFPFSFALGYSVLMDPASASKTPLAIIRHDDKRFFQTGVSTEVVDEPMWWADRDR